MLTQQMNIGRRTYPVTLERRQETARDDWNNQTPVYESAVIVEVYGWGASPATEPVVTGDNREVIELLLWCPESVGLAAGDQITLPRSPAGKFRVQGSPGQFNTSPFNDWRPGVEAKLVKVSG